MNFNNNNNKFDSKWKLRKSRPHQTWGELIVNANALLMHYFFPVIQGND